MFTMKSNHTGQPSARFYWILLLKQDTFRTTTQRFCTLFTYFGVSYRAHCQRANLVSLFLDETGEYTINVLRNNLFEIGLQDNNYNN